MFTFYLHLISQIFFISILLTSASDKLCMLKKITIIFRKVRSFHHATVCSRNHHNDTGYYIRALHSWCIRVWYLRHCGTTHYDFRLSIASRFSTCHCSFNHFIYRYRWWYFYKLRDNRLFSLSCSKIIERFPKSIILSHQ